MKQRKPIRRRTRLKAAGAAPSSSGPTKARRRTDTGPKRADKDIVFARFDGLCARCGRPAESIQHRKPRQMGGRPEPGINRLSNLVALCGDGTTKCHGEVESNRAQAREDGYLVRDALNPRLVQVRLWSGRRVYLDDEGGCKPPSAEELEGVA